MKITEVRKKFGTAIAILTAIGLTFASCSVDARNEPQSPQQQTETKVDEKDEPEETEKTDIKLDAPTDENLNRIDKESSFTGPYTNFTNGKVTYYNYTSTLGRFNVSEIEEGWFQCAVYAKRLSDIPAYSAIEMTANGKTIKLLVTDLCPAVQPELESDYYFDIEQNAFNQLSDISIGVLDVSFRTIPYPTKNNIKLLQRNSSNKWWQSFKIYNMRYPLKKVEIALDGVNYEDMTSEVDGAYYSLQSNTISFKLGTDEITSFRFTDIYNQIITTEILLNSNNEDTIYDSGVNFNY